MEQQRGPFVAPVGSIARAFGEPAAAAPPDAFASEVWALHSDCAPEALADVHELMRALRRAARSADPSPVRASEERLSADGFAALLVLGESQASIVVAPERRSCQLRFRTRLPAVHAERFALVMEAYLRAHAAQPASF